MTNKDEATQPTNPAPDSGSGEPWHIATTGPDGEPQVIVDMSDGKDSADSSEDSDKQPSVLRMVEQPAKVMRIGTMIKQLLEEVREAPLDEAGRTHLAAVHRKSVAELEDGLAPELVDELERLALPLADDGTPPSEAELRVAQAQLVGWLEGLFHGIQAAVFAQQAAAQAQLQQIRSAALPPGAQEGGSGEGPRGTGQYL